jgi:hypothetical protein
LRATIGRRCGTMADACVKQLAALITDRNHSALGRALLDSILSDEVRLETAAVQLLLAVCLGMTPAASVVEQMSSRARAYDPVREAILRRYRVARAIDVAVRGGTATIMCAAGIVAMQTARTLWPWLGRLLLVVSLPALAGLFARIVVMPTLSAVRELEQYLVEAHSGMAYVQQRIERQLANDAGRVFGSMPRLLKSALAQPSTFWVCGSLAVTSDASAPVVREVIELLRASDVEWSARESAFRWLGSVRVRDLIRVARESGTMRQNS